MLSMKNEQEQHQAFENLCGGPDKAFRLMRIWEETSNPVGGTFILSPQEKEAKRLQNFKNRATANGFSTKQINAYLEL